MGATAAGAQDRRPFTGPYVGLNAGYSWQGVEGVLSNAANPTSLSGLDLNGAEIGAQIGYNAQYDWFMIGIEADAMAPIQNNSVYNAATNVTLSSDVGYLASIRGRLGVVISSVLLYGTGGVGFSEMTLTESAPTANFYGKIRQRETGAVYGGGIEWPVVYGVTVRGEYLHFDIGNTRAIPGNFPSANAGDYVRFNDVDIARAGLNISLNP